MQAFLGHHYVVREVQSVELAGDLAIDVSLYKIQNENREDIFDGK